MRLLALAPAPRRVAVEGAAWYRYTVRDDGELAFGPAPSPPPLGKSAAGDSAARSVHRHGHGHAIYGAFHLLTGYFVAVVSEVSRVCEGPYGAAIYLVRDMAWLPVQWAASHKAPVADREDDKT